MLLRCPLCLQEMPDGTRMHRYCWRHPEATAEFQVSSSDFGGIYCPGTGHGKGCSPSSLVDEGVFLFHVGCVCTSPFLMPGSKVIDVQNRRRLANNKKVDHWEISVAERIAAKVPNRHEMWFPQALFRAANEAVDGAPLGCLVLLIGAQSVGKTVLSLMAMSGAAKRGDSVQHFAHITDSGASNEDLLRVLDALDEFRRGGMHASMMPTSAAHITNIKSVFLPLHWKPKVRAYREEPIVTPSTVIWNFIERFKPGGSESTRAPMPATHQVIAFYDLSGELWQESAGVANAAIRSNVDVQAVIVDMAAFSCFRGRSAAGSTWVAKEQLEKAKHSPGARCLIVTKLDQVLGGGATQVPGLSALADALKGEGASASSIVPDPRTILRSCLAQSRDKMERALWSLIDKDRDLTIFFVWTEGLQKDNGEVDAYGIEPFLDWCLATMSPAESRSR